MKHKATCQTELTRLEKIEVLNIITTPILSLLYSDLLELLLWVKMDSRKSEPAVPGSRIYAHLVTFVIIGDYSAT